MEVQATAAPGGCAAHRQSASSGSRTRISAQRKLLVSHLFLRSLASIFSGMAVPIIWVAPSQSNGRPCQECYHSSLYRYCGAVATISFIYSAVQLLRDIYECVKKRVPINGCRTFLLDQVVAYLLVSSSSILALMANGKVIASDVCQKMAAAAAITSFCAFFFLALSTFLSACGVAKLIQDKAEPSITLICKFFFDQLCAYLLACCSSLLIPAAGSSDVDPPCGYRRIAVTAAAISFSCFLYVAVRACVDGYEHCEALSEN